MPRTRLRDYQKTARDQALAVIRHGGGFGIWLEQRTGKTLVTLSIAEEIQPEVIWIICPKAAIRVWKAEIRKHLPNLPKVAIVEVHNYEQYCIQRKEWYQKAKQTRNLMVVCDESHRIKSRGATRSRVVRRIGSYAKYRLALTGTPIAQGIQDAWSQFNFIDPSIFGPFDDQYDDDNNLIAEGFDSRYLVHGGYKKHEIVRYRNEKEFYQKFHAHSFRRTLREVRKEPLLLHYKREQVELTRPVQRVYDRMKHELQIEVDRFKVKIKNVLACIMKLQQVTGGFVLVPDKDEYDNDTGNKPNLVPIGKEKLDKLHEVVRSLPARGKFIVIVRFIHEILAIQTYLRTLGYSVQIVRGGVPYDGKFECDCLVMQIQSGIAVDMSQANTIIFYSIDFSYLNYEQARFRILSYDKPFARYIFLIARGTIDEQIYKAVTTKQNVAKLVCDTYRGVS